MYACTMHDDGSSLLYVFDWLDSGGWLMRLKNMIAVAKYIAKFSINQESMLS